MLMFARTLSRKEAEANFLRRKMVYASVIVLVLHFFNTTLFKHRW